MNTLVWFVTLLVASSTALKPLKSWKTCPRHDPNLNECLKGAIEKALHELKNGNAKFGITPIAPLHFKEIVMDQSNSGSPVAINLKFKEIDIFGLDSVVIDKVDARWDEYNLDLYGHFESQVSTIGNYEVSGKVMVLPIQGNGKCNLTYDNFNASIKLHGEKLEKDGDEYIHFTEAKVSLDTSRLYFQLDNLFNGNEALGKNMNLFLNENWEDVLKELKPSISKAFGEAICQIANAVFLKAPLKQIAPI